MTNAGIRKPPATRSNGGPYTDVGFTGSERPHDPDFRQVLAACREGDTLVVTSLDRLARSVADATGIIVALTARGVVINLAGRIKNREP